MKGDHLELEYAVSTPQLADDSLFIYCSGGVSIHTVKFRQQVYKNNVSNFFKKCYSLNMGA